MRSTPLLVSALAGLPQALAGFDASSTKNVAVYWGMDEPKDFTWIRNFKLIECSHLRPKLI